MSTSSTTATESDSDSDDQSQHILEIDLDSLESARTILTARRATTSNFRDGKPPAQEDFDIAASLLHFSGEGHDARMQIITRSPGSEQMGPRERWIHLATECITFDDFKSHALNITLQHHPDWTPVVMYLLNHVKDNYEQSSAYGKYITPGTVLRCDGMERHHRDKPDISVAFVSFPFFDVAESSKIDIPRKSSLHATRCLFQQFYPQEITTDRDENQQFRHFRQVKSGQCLRVPQIWALVLDSTTVITCSPCSLVTTAERWLKIIPEDSLANTNHRLIHVTDFYKRVTCLNPEHCRSYLALQQSIQKECLAEWNEDIGRCILHLGDDEAALDPALWPALLREARTTFIYIRITLRRLTIEAQGVEPMQIEASKMLMLLDYTDLSSDDESSKDMRLALVRRGHQSPEATMPNEAMKAAARIRTRLETEGYVINVEKQLNDDDSVPGTKPKIFKRPTIAQMVDKAQDPGEISTESILNAGDVEGATRPTAFKKSYSKAVPPKVKQVRFPDVESDWQLERPRSSRSQSAQGDWPRTLGTRNKWTDDDATSGASSPGPSVSISQASSPQVSPEGSEDGSATAWSDFIETDVGATSELFNATVEDYHSSTSSFEMDATSHVPVSINTDVDRMSHASTSTDAAEKMLEDEDLRSIHTEGSRHLAQDEGLSKITDLQKSSLSPDDALQRGRPSNSLLDRHDLDQSIPSRRGGTAYEEIVTTEGTVWSDEEDDHSSVRAKSVHRASSLNDRELKQVIRDEINAALRHNEDQVEALFRKRHEQEMRTKLARSGFPESQIRALLLAEEAEKLQHQRNTTPRDAPPPPALPTFAKISRQHLDTETLHYYDIPYEYDVDPNYIIVLREMSRSEINVLFEHTRRLRSRQQSSSRDWTRQYPDPSGTGDLESSPSRERRKEYAFVRKASRERSRSSENHQPNRGDDRQDGRQRSMSPPVHRQVDPTLRVPPFLAWPTTFETRRSQNCSEDVHDELPGFEGNDDMRIKLTLFAIVGRIYPTSIERTKSLLIYKSGDLTVEISAQSCLEKKSHDIDLGSISSTSHDSAPRLVNLQQELVYLRSSERGKGAETHAYTTPAPNRSSDDAKSVSSSKGRPARRMMFWQAAKLCIARDTLVSTLQQLIGQFVPEHFDHTLIYRCWGAVETISTILRTICIDNDGIQSDVSKGFRSDIFIIKDVPEEDYLKLHNVMRLKLPIDECLSCRKRVRYADVDDAIQHLLVVHVGSMQQTDATERHSLRHWLVPVALYEQERDNEEMLRFTEKVNNCAAKLLSKAIDIRTSVANKDSERDGKYLLPTALVKAAEKIFQFVYYTAHSFQVWHDDRMIPIAPEGAPALLADLKTVTGSEYFAKVADIAMSNARDELMLLAHTGESRDPVLHLRMTPETTVLATLILLGAHHDRPLLQDFGILELYREQLVRLRYEASRKPSKRVLRELYLWSEEIEVVASVMSQQTHALRKMRQVLDSDGFRITNRVRIEAFQNLESPVIEDYTGQYRSKDKDEMRSLQKEADKLAAFLRHNIDIAEEGNSKAILIFTLVTIVFLPLSFVSSVFGMNTTDVRNMASTQTLFWAVALPVTAAVGGISLLAAYGGPPYKRLLQRMGKVEFDMGKYSSKKQLSDDDEEKARQVEITTVSKERSGKSRSKRGVIIAAKRRILHEKEVGRHSTITRSPGKVTLGDMIWR